MSTIPETKKLNQAFKELGKIDTKHESGKITKGQHDKQSKEVLKKLIG